MRLRGKIFTAEAQGCKVIQNTGSRSACCASVFFMVLNFLPLRRWDARNSKYRISQNTGFHNFLFNFCASAPLR
jgi:hypothetical protein